ncbi:MAG: PTS system mannose/fructose/sorbose family transporter subunit IID [Candidatus Bathyarchaeota archaeon]|nr:PTS system mannose/fructose/sorbose family transporter subunit IID [Candidatus Bathyarchaeota archaeon]
MATVIQALLCAIYTVLAYQDALMQFSHFHVPTIAGLITGAIMGDVTTGLIIGGTCELIFIGIYPVGGARPPEPTVGTIIGTSVAIETGMGIELALPIAVPIAVLGAQVFTLVLTSSVVFIHAADRYNEEGKFGSAYWMHLIAGPLMISGGMALLVFIGVWLGAEPVSAFNTWVATNAPWLWGALGVGASCMVPVGLAALLRIYWNMRFIPFFLIGFTLAAVMGVGIVPIALIGGAVGLIFYVYVKLGPGTQTDGGSKAKVEKKITSSDLWGAFWRHHLLQNSWCFERMQALGYYYAIMPVVEKFFTKEEAIERGKMHLEFYNTHPSASAIVLGINLALTEQKQPIDVVRSMKNGLIGPMAGIGDSLMGFAARAIIVSIGASMALAGNFMGPILILAVSLLMFNGVKWLLMTRGYKLGLGIIDEMRRGGVEKVTTAIGILGSMAIGTILATWVSITTPLKYVVGEIELVSLQAVLDGMLPKLLPLVTLILAITALRRGLTITKTMLLFFLVGALLAAVGILG